MEQIYAIGLGAPVNPPGSRGGSPGLCRTGIYCGSVTEMARLKIVSRSRKR